MKKLSVGIIAMALLCLLAGCGGGSWNPFGRSNSDYSLYFDGYDTGIHPDPAGNLDLTGLPLGQHMLSVVSSDKSIGFHTVQTIGAAGQLALGQITLTKGSLISGKVERAAGVPMAFVRVAAISGGGALLASGQGTLQLPAGATQTVIVGFTDETGKYSLGPATPGTWLVTGAAPGLHADAAIATVATSVNAAGINLMLSPDDTAQKGVVSGTVTKEGAGAIASAFVAANLGTSFKPPVEAARAAALQAQIGTALMAQPWFAWSSVATQTSLAGAYSFASPAGSQSINAFKFGYHAKSTDVVLANGQSLTADFSLPAL